MGLRISQLTCLSLLLLLLLLQLKAPCFADGSGRFSRFKGGYGAELKPVKPHGGFKANAGKDADEIFGADKRKINTGPNPLHNR